VKTSPPVTVDPVAKRVPQALPQKPAPVASTAAVPTPPTPQPTQALQAVAPPAIRSASGGIPGLNELPEDIRRQIPALNISGAAYSESTKEWVLLINDQVRAKGSQVNSDLRVEEIGDTSAIFNFRGQRFRIDR
jgi:general secretion pathway protein B